MEKADVRTRAGRPTIAAVIPVYNRAGLIGRAIESALGQMRPPDEIVVVDDGSTDDTAAVAAAYGHPVRVIRQPNSGVSVARNLGITQTNCEFIAFLDSDDLWDPLHLQQMEGAIIATEGRAVLYSRMYPWAQSPGETFWAVCGFEIDVSRDSGRRARVGLSNSPTDAHSGIRGAPGGVFGGRRFGAAPFATRRHPFVLQDRGGRRLLRSRRQRGIAHARRPHVREHCVSGRRCDLLAVQRLALSRSSAAPAIFWPAAQAPRPPPRGWLLGRRKTEGLCRSPRGCGQCRTGDAAGSRDPDEAPRKPDSASRSRNRPFAGKWVGGVG